jgi:flavorubredoxin
MTMGRKYHSRSHARAEGPVKVLVCAASKHGATKEIAEAIGRRLAEAGLTVDLNDVEEVNDIAQYDAVVLGSAVYVARRQTTGRNAESIHPTEDGRFSYRSNGRRRRYRLIDARAS